MTMDTASGSELNRQPPTKVFSIRLSDAERARLEELAGSVPVGTYIRQRIFEASESHVRLRRHRNRSRDDIALSKLLASLGQSRLSSNLNQLAKAVHLGVLTVTPETEAEIAEACIAISAMRRELIAALGLNPS